MPFPSGDRAACRAEPKPGNVSNSEANDGALVAKPWNDDTRPRLSRPRVEQGSVARLRHAEHRSEMRCGRADKLHSRHLRLAAQVHAAAIRSARTGRARTKSWRVAR